MKEKMKLILLKPGENYKIVELSKDHELDDLYQLIECHCVDCVSRKVGNKFFDFWIDDNGLLKDKLFTTCFNMEEEGGNCYEVLCGNILIANFDSNGEMVGLTEDDINLITSHLQTFESSRVNPVIFKTTYGEIRIKNQSQFLTYQYQ